MTRTKQEKKSTAHLKVKKGAGERLTLKINRQEMPMIDSMLKAESRLALRRDFGITLAEDVDWPTSNSRYSERLKVLQQYLAHEGQKKLQAERAGAV